MTGIEMRISTIFDGNIGWQHNGYTYRLAVGAQTIEAPNGDLICGWMTGGDKQPAEDHVFVYARSEDRGQSWSQPEVLAGGNGQNGGGNLFRVGDRLFAMCAIWEDHYNIWHYTRRESHDNGKTWTGAVPITLLEGDGLSSNFGNLLYTSDGELLGCGTFIRRREKRLLASAERLAFAKDEAEAQNMEPRRPDESGILHYEEMQAGLFSFGASADLTTFTTHGRVCNRPLGLLEPNIFELEPGHLILLCRADWGGYLWRSDSFDGGRHWSDGYQTDIPNSGSLAQLLRLPDGRIALFHTPTGGVVGRAGPRDRLSVWVSRDEMKSWYIQEDIILGGYVTHPCPLVLQDGTVAFSYDKNQRWAEYVEINIP